MVEELYNLGVENNLLNKSPKMLCKSLQIWLHQTKNVLQQKTW